VSEHLLEYQDYALAYRLRALVGGELRSQAPYLSLPQYARKRLERQLLARELIGTGDYRERLRRVERLTDELNFGFWHNPAESIEFLRKLIGQGGHRALESEAAFIEALLTRRERERLGSDAWLVARYYLGLLRASASYLDAEVFTRLRAEIERLREALPVFVLES
jgi:hypothetical protein